MIAHETSGSVAVEDGKQNSAEPEVLIDRVQLTFSTTTNVKDFKKVHKWLRSADLLTGFRRGRDGQVSSVSFKGFYFDGVLIADFMDDPEALGVLDLSGELSVVVDLNGTLLLEGRIDVDLMQALRSTLSQRSDLEFSDDHLVSGGRYGILELLDWQKMALEALTETFFIAINDCLKGSDCPNENVKLEAADLHLEVRRDDAEALAVHAKPQQDPNGAHGFDLTGRESRSEADDRPTEVSAHVVRDGVLRVGVSATGAEAVLRLINAGPPINIDRATSFPFMLEVLAVCGAAAGQIGKVLSPT